MKIDLAVWLEINDVTCPALNKLYKAARLQDCSGLDDSGQSGLGEVREGETVEELLYVRSVSPSLTSPNPD